MGSVDIQRIECDPFHFVVFDSCRIRVICENSRQKEDIQSVRFKAENQTFYFAKQELTFEIKQIFGNSLLIQIQCDDRKDDQIQIPMEELTKSRERLHRFAVFQTSVLWLNTKWELQ